MIRAFSPGSVTLFFDIRDKNKDPLKKGSRGVGVCISRGVITEIEKSNRLEVVVNGKKMKNTLQEIVANEYDFTGKIISSIQLPVSQGFGISGAAALSTSLAIGKIKNYTYIEAAQLAHRAELTMKTGLGDVASQYEGGFTIRKREGIPPYGIVDRLIIPDIKITLVVFNEGIKTSSVLQDPTMRKKIIKEGYKAMNLFLKSPSLKNAIKIARKFSIRTSLITEEGKNFLECCENSAIAMIGNSAVVFGKCNTQILEDYKTYQVNIGSRAKLIP